MIPFISLKHSLFLFFVAVFSIENSDGTAKTYISANLKFKISEEFIQGIKNDIYDMVDSEMSYAKNGWRYYRDFDDKTMKETDDGVITIRSSSSPIVSYHSIGGQNGNYDYIKVRYPEVKLFWKYEFYYTPLWIPIYWGMGYNYYKIENLEFKFRFTPPRYSNGQLGGVDITLLPSTDYTNFAWTWKSGEGDQYGDKLNSWRYYNDVIYSLSSFVRNEIQRSYLYRSLENNINRAIHDLPSMQNSGLIKSSDLKTMADIQKLIKSEDMDYSTRFMYRYPQFWMDISMTHSGSWSTFPFDPNPPPYDVEIHLKNAAVSPEVSVIELQRQALGKLNANDLKTYFFPEGEHETFLKVNNSEEDEILLTLSDKKEITLSEVKKDDQNAFYRELNWLFQLAGIDIKQDFFSGPTVQYKADFSIYSLKGDREVSKNQTTYSVVTKVPCELRASLEDIAPPVEDKPTRDEVLRKIAKFKEGVEQSCEGQQLETYWKVPKPKGMSFYGYGVSVWEMGSSSFNLDFYAKLKND